MEPIATSTVGTVGGLASFFLLNKIMLWMKRRKAKGLLILKGKTTLCSRYSNNECVFLDVDTILEALPTYHEAKSQPSKLFLLYPIVRQQVDMLTRNIRKRIVYVSSNYELLRMLNVAKANIFFLCGTQEGHSKSQLLYDKPEEFALDDTRRLKYLHQLPKKQTMVFNNLTEIDRLVRQLFKLRVQTM